MALCSITGTIHLSNGEPAMGRDIMFRRADRALSATVDGVVIPDRVVVQSDGAGFVEVELYTGTYRVDAGGRGPQQPGHIGTVVVPDAAAASIEEIFSFADIPASPPIWFAEQGARIDANSIDIEDLLIRVAALEGGGSGVAPAILEQPSLLPVDAEVGDTITVSLGAASGSPSPVVDWDLLLGGVSVKGQVTGGQITAAAGTYTLSASWNNTYGTAVATPATLTVQAVGPEPSHMLSGTTFPSQPQAQPANLLPVESGEMQAVTGWNLPLTGLTMDTAAGLARWDGTSTTQQFMTLPFSGGAATAGREYGLITSVPARTAGQLSLGLGTPSAVTSTGTLTAPRTRSARLAATGASAGIRLTVGSGSNLNIDYVRAYDLTLLMQKKWRIVVVYSQSNWVGNEAAEANTIIYTPEPRALYVPCVANTTFGSEVFDAGTEYGMVGRPMPAVDPMQHQTANVGGGPGTSFCRSFADGLRDDEVLIYVAAGYAGGARGAGGVWNRQEGGAAWVKMERTVDYYRSIAPVGSTVAGMIFCQGESDRSTNPTPHTELIRGDFLYCRSKWGEFPIVVMEIGTPVEGNTAIMIAEQQKLDSNSGDALAVPNCRYIARPVNAVLRPDQIHFDQPTCEARGVQAAQGLLSLNYA